MQNDQDKKILRLGRSKKIGLILLGLFFIYLIAGFWIVPPLLKNQLQYRLTDMLGRQVTIGSIKLNPLTLSATTSQLTVHEIDGGPFAGFDQLYINAELSSLFRWAIMVKEIQLSAPFAELRLMAEGKLNIDDLVAKVTALSSPSDINRRPVRALISHFEVISGRFTFTDLASSEPVQDIITPITFTVENLSTLEGRKGNFHVAGKGPIGGQFDLTGNVELNPLSIRGHFATKEAQLSHHWAHVKDLVSFQIVDGRLSLSGDFFAAIDDSGLIVRMENGAVQLDDFKLAAKGQNTPLIALPSFTTTGIQADLKTHTITVESVETADARIHSWLSADGIFILEHLLLTDLETLMKIKANIQPAPAAPPTKPWQITLKKVATTNGQLAFGDRTLPRPARMSADGIHVIIENLSTKKGTQATVGVTMQLNRKGRINVDGVADINAFQADMKIVAREIALKPFQAYVDESVKARISNGSISAAGRIRYQGKGARPQIKYTGNFSVDDLQLKDRVQTDDFVTLKQIKTNGITLELLPNTLAVEEVLIDRPHASVSIDKAGTINVLDALAPATEIKKPGQPNLLQRLVRFLITQFKGPMPVHVDRIRVDRFTGDFTDASVSPAFSTQVEITEAMVNGLSSETSVQADFKFDGRIDQAAAFQASGQLIPMKALHYGKMDLSVKDFSLSSVSSYAGKYMGYKIDRGALQSDLKYTIDEEKVDGDNIIVIDGLELGEAVDSPDALNLPIKLAVTLLKDGNGRIALEVPVIGDIKDPHFDLATALKSALTGTIKKAGSQPFAAIREIDGFTGEELKDVAFQFGLSALLETETRKLNALASYLKEKEALTLGIVAMADRIMDGAAVMGKAPPQNAADSRLQEKAHAPAEKASVDPIDNKRLEALAQRRAATVSNYLIEKAGIESARIKIEPVQIKSDPPDNNAFVAFNLSAK